MTHEIAVIPGDGIGQEVTPAAIDVLEAVPPSFEFVSGEAGDAVKAETGEALPAETRTRAAEADATLFGAAGETAAPNASREIAEFGFSYARRNDYDTVTIAHKANVMRETDGLFLETAEAVARERSADYDTALMDALAMHLVQHPEDYGVVICPNLAGDVLSDLAAGLVGGLGLLPSANVGPENAMFEPVHGSAPDIAGEGIANPAAMILSAAMLLDHLGYTEESGAVHTAVESVLADGPLTPDLGGEASTEAVTDAVLARL